MQEDKKGPLLYDGIKHYPSSHEWVLRNGDRVRVGLTCKACQELGEVVYVELPRVGERIKEGAMFAVVESTKAATDLYAPLSGHVTQINIALQSDPTLLNSDPEGAGWLLELCP